MAELKLIDTHCHIDFEQFDPDRTTVLEQAHGVGVEGIIVPATRYKDWPNTIAVCKKHGSCHLAIGLHPIFIDEHKAEHIQAMPAMITQHNPVAVGEIGLDYYIRELCKKSQQRVFVQQLIIAKQYTLPVLLHVRKAHDNTIAILKEHAPCIGIIHAFNGSIQQAEQYIELGFVLGFGGMLTYPRSSKLKRLVANLPLDKIVLETDAPDMTVAQHKGERNSPVYLPYILTEVARIKKMAPEQVAEITYNTSQHIFSL